MSLVEYINQARIYDSAVAPDHLVAAPAVTCDLGYDFVGIVDAYAAVPCRDHARVIDISISFKKVVPDDACGDLAVPSGRQHFKDGIFAIFQDTESG